MHQAGRQNAPPAKASQRYKFKLGNGHYSRPFTLFQRIPQIYRIYAKTELCRQTDHNRYRTKGGFAVKVAFYFRVSKELPEQPVKYSFEEIRKFDKSLPIKEWLKIRPATDKKSLLRK